MRCIEIWDGEGDEGTLGSGYAIDGEQKKYRIILAGISKRNLNPVYLNESIKTAILSQMKTIKIERKK